MPIVKARSLSKYGIITDVDPYDLPPEAFSFGYNVRFRNGRVSRAPVFRSAKVLTGASDPRFVYATNPTSGLDQLFVCYRDGRVFLTTASSETDYSVSGYTPSTSDAVWSGCHLADVTYLNKADRVPWYITGASSAYTALPNWDSTWRAQLLRSCGGALVALNVTKGATTYPTMVKTSSVPLSGAVPASWDETNPATNATENILAELDGPIVDAQGFGNNLVIYGHNQAWLMQKVTGFEIFDYYKLPFQKGAINANCSVEVDGKHFVMGPDDIWVHDGVSEKSICDMRVREFIFASINTTKTSLCFVSHNPLLKEIAFCFVSGDRGVSFMNTTGCNRQAVYNYVNDTWTFDDLPSVYSSTSANLSVALTYSTVSSTYAAIGGSYQGQEGGYKRTPVYVGDSNTTYTLSTSLYAFDLFGEGSTVAFSVDTNATKGSHLERDGIHLDSLFEDGQLSDYYLIKSVWPLARVDDNANTALNIAFGSADYFGQTATFDGPSMTYDGVGEYQLDYNMAGRFLSMTLDYNDYTTFSLSGFDLAVDVTAQR
jgi:hypothetical protein